MQGKIKTDALKSTIGQIADFFAALRTGNRIPLAAQYGKPAVRTDIKHALEILGEFFMPDKYLPARNHLP